MAAFAHSFTVGLAHLNGNTYMYRMKIFRLCIITKGLTQHFLNRVLEKPLAESKISSSLLVLLFGL